MTAHSDLDRQLNDFLRDGPEELPYQSFDAVRDRTEQTGQRVVIGPWRLPDMNKILTIGLGAAAVVVAVFVGAQLFGSPSGGVGSQPTQTPMPTATPQPTATPEPSSSLAGGLPPGPHPVTKAIEGGVEVTVTIAAPLWDGEPDGGYLCWGDPAAECAGPPDGAGLIAFNDREYYVYRDPCAWSSTRPDTPAATADELVNALANQASREASTPEDITVDGYAGKKIILQMVDDVDIGACDEGSFALFAVPGEERARFSQGLGQTEEVWAVDVDGRMVVLIGLYYADTPQNAVDELRAILASATFDQP